MELTCASDTFKKRVRALQAVNCCYSIELKADNIAECRENMLEVFASYLRLHSTDAFRRAAPVFCR